MIVDPSFEGGPSGFDQFPHSPQSLVKFAKEGHSSPKSPQEVQLMVGLNTAVEVRKGKRYKHKANKIAIPSAAYRSPFVKTCADEFQKITQDHRTLTNYSLVDNANKRY